MLHLESLGVDIVGEAGRLARPVSDVSFSVPEGSITAVVGESGSGKTLTGLAIIGLLPKGVARVSTGSRIVFRGRSLLDLSPKERIRLHGREIGMVFQDPGESLNPVLTIGRQLIEPLIVHLGMHKRQARERAIELLQEVGIANPEQRMNAYPHELSGGQQQRIMLGIAIACEPKLLIADEPTSALDVTVQRQILDLMLRIRREHCLSIVFISHDLAVVSQIADHVVVMRRGVVVEQGAVDDVLVQPTDPYTKGLVSARARLSGAQSDKSGMSPWKERAQPGLSTGRSSEDAQTLLKINQLNKDYRIRSGLFRSAVVSAVKNVSFALRKGETVGVVGESGSGKTTLAMMLLRLLQPTSGSICLGGADVHGMSAAAFRPLRRRIQIVFQNPHASLNPRWKIERTLTEPMKLHGIGEDGDARREKAASLLERVGLKREALDRYPHQFSGGECQRIAIGRCLTVNPEIIVCDECVSALDVSTQLQVLNLLKDIQAKLGLSYLFISHDLSVVRFVSDRVLVFQAGQIVEQAATEDLFRSQQHPYTQQLIASVPLWPCSS